MTKAYRYIAGIATKITRRYDTANGSASGGVFIARNSRSQNTQPVQAITIEIATKNVLLVPTTRFASVQFFAPMYCPTSTVAAIDSPKAPPSSRNMIAFEFAVAVSAASPRNRPTQIELI